MIKSKIEKETNHKIELQVLMYRNGSMGCTICNNDNTIEELYAPRILALKIESLVHLTLKYENKTAKIQKFASTNLVNEVAEITENKIILSALICAHDDYDQMKVIIYGFVRRIVNDVLSDDVMSLMVNYYYIARRVVNIFKALTDECHTIEDNDTITICKDTNKKYIEYADFGDESFNIFVRTLTCKTLTIGVKISSTIKDVKESIYHKEGIPLCAQSLVFRGMFISDDDMNMMECHIEPESTLHLMMSR